MARQGVRIRVALLSALTAIAIMASVPATASAAASSYSGGPDAWPSYVSNDHTPFAVRFTADAGGGLAPNTSYYVKVRIIVGTTPSGATNRGFTWNPVTHTWVQERENWTYFPTVTTDANGAIGSGAGWVFAKFGDDTKSGTYHILVSLSATGESSTYNGSNVPTITVIDPRGSGGWVHNGVATGKAASKRAEVTDAASAVLALNKTEAQLLDDDSNGLVDDEDWGAAGTTGDFHMSVPASTPIGVTLNQETWAPAAGFISGPADVDLAISADDTVAPSAPGALSAEAGDATASITWAAASDDTGVAGYYVYRWLLAPDGVAYSPIHSRIATVGAAETSYVDSGLTNGATYHYEVRAFDAATNVGPRSVTATATPMKIVAQVSPASPDGENGWYVTVPTVTLQPTPGKTGLYSFAAAPSTWTTYTAPFDVPAGTTTLLYRETDGVSMTATESLLFKVDMVAPIAFVSAPTFSVSVASGRSFRVSWNGWDGASGATNYDIDYKTSASGAWIRWRSSTPDKSALFTGAAGSDNYFRARAVDAAGNVSPWTNAMGTIVPFDNTKARYFKSWKSARGSAYYLGSSRYSTKKGGYATLPFTKGTLYLVAKKGPKLGKMAVYLGGARVGTVSLYSRTTKYRQVIKLLTRSTGTKVRTVKLVNLGTRGRSRVEIDGFALKQ